MPGANRAITSTGPIANQDSLTTWIARWRCQVPARISGSDRDEPGGAHQQRDELNGQSAIIMMNTSCSAET